MPTNMVASMDHPAPVSSTEPVISSRVMERTSCLNTKGAILLAHGDWKGALVAFRNSLESLLSYMTTVENPPGVGVDPTSVVFFSEVPSSSPFAALHIPQEDTESLSDPFLYKRPLVLEASMLITHMPSQETCLVFCAVITFNMAIAIHQRSIWESRVNAGDSDFFAEKAIHLYDSAINFLARSSPMDGGKAFAALMAAILNNKIQIYEMNERFDDLEHNASNLRQVVACLSPAPANVLQSSVTSKTLHDGELEGILLNLLLLNRSTTARAA